MCLIFSPPTPELHLINILLTANAAQGECGCAAFAGVCLHLQNLALAAPV
jgi:hypothetical protein